MIWKKFIAAFLVICFAIQIPALLPSAEEGNKTAESAYGILRYLEIMPQDSDYEMIKNNSVTRGEFAVYLAKLFGISGISETVNFSDTDKSTAKGKAVYALASIGVFNGYGDGSFRPDDIITVEEMAVSSVRALGYNGYTLWETANYMKKARDLDLLDGIGNLAGASMSDCIVLLYNVLHTNTVSIAQSGLKLVEYEEKTPLESVFKLKYVKGIVTSNAYAALDGPTAADKNHVCIDGVMYSTDVPSISEWLGYKITAYYSAEDDKNSIVYFVEDIKNTTLVIDADDLDSYDENYIKYRIDGKGNIKRINISSDAVIIKNSSVVTTDYKSAFDIDYGKITCISYDGKCSTVIIEAYENYMITGYDTSRRVIYTDRKDKDGNPISISLYNKEYVEFTMIPYGKEVNESVFEPDDLISVVMSADGKVIRGYLCSDTVNGKVESVSNQGKAVYMTVNGVSYKADPYFYKTYAPSVGDEGVFTLDAGGRIAAFSKSAAQQEMIGYVYKLYESDSGDELFIRLYNVQREHIDAQLAETINFNGSPLKAYEVKSELCTQSGGSLKRQLIMYKLNSEGKIVMIYTSAQSEGERLRDNTLYTQLPKGSYNWYYQMKVFERRYAISGNTYYMRVPPESSPANNKTLFGCQKFSSVTWYNSSGSKPILGLYKFNDDTPYSDVLLVQNTDGATLTTQTEITVVSSLNKALGPDGDIVTELHGYRRGVEVTAYIQDDVYRNDIETGDIVRFATNVNGYVGAYELVYDYSEDDVKWEQGSNANDYTSNISSASSGLRYTFGYVNNLYLAPYSTGLNSLLQIGSAAGVTEDTYQINSNASATTRYIIVDGSRPSNKVYMGDFYEVNAYNDCHDADSTSRAFVHTRSGWLIAVIIYK